jgi:hypothetical protein
MVKNLKLFFLLFFLLFVFSYLMAEENIIWFGDYVYFAKPVTNKIVIDGNLNESDWGKASILTNFVGYLTRDIPAQTELKFLFDDKYIYIGGKFFAINIDSLVTNEEECGALERNDSIEIFLDTQHKHSNFYQVIINAIGKVSILHSEKEGRSPRNGYLMVQGSLQKHEWILEMAFDRKKFGVSNPCECPIGIAFLRNHFEGKQRLFSCWPETLAKASLKRSDLWGHLVLLDEQFFNHIKKNFQERVEMLKNIKNVQVVKEGQEGIEKLEDELRHLNLGNPLLWIEFEKKLICLENKFQKSLWEKRFEELFEKEK